MKLFVAIPSGTSVPARFLNCTNQLCFAAKEGLVIEQFFGAGVINARIVAANRFLETDCTHLLTIDSDIVNWNGMHVQQLIAREKAIVGGFYMKKQKEQVYVCSPLKVGEPVEPDAEGLIELRRIGTGFLLVKREVFERMKEKWRDSETFINQQKKEMFNFYPMGVVNREYVSEDWYFCDRARELGYRIYGDTKVTLGHLGDHIY